MLRDTAARAVEMRWKLPFADKSAAPLMSPIQPPLDAATAEILSNGTTSPALQRAWTLSQEAVVLRSSKAVPLVSMLYIAPISNNLHTVNRFGQLFGKQRSHKILWLCHYDHNASVWEQQQWYINPTGPVMYRDLMGGPGELACKPHCWRRVALPERHGYEYIMMMDEDLGFEHFSLPLASLVLEQLGRPLVWQPAVTGVGTRGGTSVFPLNMVGVKGASGRVPIAFESSRTEVMARAVSWRLWAAFHERVRSTNPTIDWYDEFWDALAIATRLECNATGPLVINGSPLTHLNFRTLYHDVIPSEQRAQSYELGLIRSPSGIDNRSSSSSNDSDDPRPSLSPGPAGLCGHDPRPTACFRCDDMDAIATINRPLRPRERDKLAEGLAGYCDERGAARVTRGIFNGSMTFMRAFHVLSKEYETQLRWWY